MKVRHAKRILVGALLMQLGGCYESDTPLLAGKENEIISADAVVAVSGQVLYFSGTGKSISACSIESRSDFPPHCSNMGEISVRRTAFGNYVVQFLSARKYYYGIWFRSDDGPQGKIGNQCFVWLGQYLVGQSAKLAGGPAARDQRLARTLLGIAPDSTINKDQLDRLVSAYEGQFIVSQECLGERVRLLPQALVIDGDNRHLPAFR